MDAATAITWRGLEVELGVQVGPKMHIKLRCTGQIRAALESSNAMLNTILPKRKAFNVCGTLHALMGQAAWLTAVLLPQGTQNASPVYHLYM